MRYKVDVKDGLIAGSIIGFIFNFFVHKYLINLEAALLDKMMVYSQEEFDV